MHLPCYGKLFPSMACRQTGEEYSVGVFTYVYPPPGTVARAPEIRVDLAAWDRCVKCGQFETCRQLSVATLLLEIATRD